MFAEIWHDLKAFINKKWFLAGLLTVSVLSYVTLLINPAVSIDDTAIDVYFEQGVAPAVGRWCIYLINRLFPVAYNPYFVECAGVLCFSISVALWCVVFYRILGNKVNHWIYLAFACMMVSNPIIAEVIPWYLQNGQHVGYGVAAIAVYAFVQGMFDGSGLVKSRKWVGSLIVATVFLTIAMGFYESFIIVWVIGILMSFMLMRMTGLRNASHNPWIWLLKAVACLVGAVALRTIVVKLLTLIFHLQEEATVLRSRGLHEVLGWFDGSKSLEDFLYVMKEFLVKYYVNAIVYLPIMLLVLAIGILGLVAIWQSVRLKDGWIITAAVGIILVPWVMPVLEGVATYYRSSQYIPLLTAFAVLLVGWLLSEYRDRHALQSGRGKLMQCIAIVVFAIVLYNQMYDMNRWLYLDARKYEDTKNTLEEIALRVGREMDASKPVCIIGRYDVPEGIVQEAYCPDWSKKYMLTEWIVTTIDEDIFDSYCDEYGYAFAETPRLSFITWGATAFYGFDREIIKFWSMHGYSFAEDNNLAHYEEARELMKDGPVWPQEGSVVEMEDYIIVNFGY